MLELTDDPNIDGNDYVVAKNIAETLHKHYPGHLWAVTCEGRTGMASIRNLALSPNYGFTIRLAELFGDWQIVIRAGGEILERFGQHRGRMNSAHIEALPHGPDGFPLFDTAGMKGRVPYRYTQSPAPAPNLIVEPEWQSKQR